MRITVNGIEYEATPVVPPVVDCDGREIKIGEKAYVRLSAMGNYPNVDESNRHGRLSDHGDGFLSIKFDDGRAWDFPTNEVRRVKFQ